MVQTQPSFGALGNPLSIYLLERVEVASVHFSHMCVANV